MRTDARGLNLPRIAAFSLQKSFLGPTETNDPSVLDVSKLPAA
jgi:hypothetical protein